MESRSLSVFIPVFNEEKIIDNNLPVILAEVEKIARDFEILIIDDGSTDHSGERLKAWAAKCNKIRILQHPKNLGYGAALRSGFSNAQKELIFYTDMDLPADLSNLQKAIPLMEVKDLVIGYRTDRQDTFRRMIYFKVYKFLLKLLFGLEAKDINFSFKCIRKKVLEKVNLSARTGFIDGELLINSIENGFTLQEIPIIYRPRKCGNSNFDSFKAAWNTAKEILLYWWAKNRNKKRTEACK
ncbi:MAG: glycosyltransferase family 2 protein [Candidatus Omnitrophica bacterium]|nr:glycosyltransferase family 2 protein [Candidatus Omnitrophota bacterium]